jgi:hypothetical protein
MPTRSQDKRQYSSLRSAKNRIMLAVHAEETIFFARLRERLLASLVEGMLASLAEASILRYAQETIARVARSLLRSLRSGTIARFASLARHAHYTHSHPISKTQSQSTPPSPYSSSAFSLVSPSVSRPLLELRKQRFYAGCLLDLAVCGGVGVWV